MEYSFSHIAKHKNLFDFVRQEIWRFHHHNDIDNQNKSRQYSIIFHNFPHEIVNKRIDIEINPLRPKDAFCESNYILIYDFKLDEFKYPLNISNVEAYKNLASILYNSIKTLNGVDDRISSIDLYKMTLTNICPILFPSYFQYEAMCNENNENEFNNAYRIAIDMIENLNIDFVKYQQVYEIVKRMSVSRV